MSSADNGYVSVNYQIAVSAKAGERCSWNESWRSSKSANKQTRQIYVTNDRSKRPEND